MDLHRWRRLHQAFNWDALKVEVDQFREKPTISAILGRIPFETILVVPTPGRYSIIYADPPWTYNFAQFQDVRIKYPTLTVEQIIDYEIDGKLLKWDYFDKDAVLSLWAIPLKLVEALTVMAAWGFEYKITVEASEEVVNASTRTPRRRATAESSRFGWPVIRRRRSRSEKG